MAIGFEARGACPVCAAADAQTLCELEFADRRLAAFIDDFYAGRVPLAVLAGASYRVLACNRCGLVYQDPILNDDGMAALYEAWIDAAASLAKKQRAPRKLFAKYAGQIQTLARLIARSPGEVRVLDYGMGWGYWARMATAHGYAVEGFEPSPSRRAHARVLGVAVLDRLPRAEPRYDYILASQVLEHVPDPRSCLADLAARLAPDGILHLRVPDGRGVAARLARRGWSPDLDAIHPLEHINCFTRDSLLFAARDAGLDAFDPPLRLQFGSLVGGLRREWRDRRTAPHLYLRRA